jgi:hypothetical protein
MKADWVLKLTLKKIIADFQNAKSQSADIQNANRQNADFLIVTITY